jgi:hypothetical protein
MALNRKNALFAGSDEGAENWAVLATLIECCKLHDVNPHSYLTDGKRSFIATLRSACRAGEGCWLVPGLLLRA